jgi:general secretion pathway protein H
LIEMMVVLLVLALVAGLFAPMLRQGGREKNLDATVSELQSVFLRAHANAIARGMTETIRLDMAGREIAYEGQKLAIPQHLTAKLLIGRELLATDGQATLLFFADGGSSGAEIALTDRRQNTLVVVVSWLTGVATLSRGAR